MNEEGNGEEKDGGKNRAKLKKVVRDLFEGVGHMERIHIAFRVVRDLFIIITYPYPYIWL